MGESHFGIVIIPDVQLASSDSINDTTVQNLTAAIELSDPFVDRKTKGIEV